MSGGFQGGGRVRGELARGGARRRPRGEGSPRAAPAAATASPRGLRGGLGSLLVIVVLILGDIVLKGAERSRGV